MRWRVRTVVLAIEKPLSDRFFSFFLTFEQQFTCAPVHIGRRRRVGATEVELANKKQQLRAADTTVARICAAALSGGRPQRAGGKLPHVAG